MKNNLTWYKHENNSHNHAKFKALRAVYGWSGEGRFWALNNEISKAENCALDLSKNYNRLTLAVDLDLSPKKLDKYIDFLVNQVELIKREDDKITTNIVQELFDKVNSNREGARLRKQASRQRQKDVRNTNVNSEQNEDVTGLSRVTTSKSQVTDAGQQASHAENEESHAERNNREEKRREEKRRKEKTNKKEDVGKLKISDSVSEKGNDQIEVEKTIDELKAEFDVVRKKFKNKLGLDEAFQQFRNKCRSDKKLRETLPLLLPAVEREIALREQAEREKAEGIEAFYPRMKNFRTWISQSCWNQETEIDYSKAKNKFSSVNNPDSARINDAELSESRAEEYKKYLKWVEKDFPVLIRSECKIFSKKEFDDVKTDNFFKARKERVTDKKLTQMIKDSHSELNLKGYERQKFSCFSHIKAAVKKVFDNVYS